MNNRNFKPGNGRNDKRSDFRKNENRRNNLECSYCHGTNHTRDRCYHLNGFPPRTKPQNSSSNDKVIAQVTTGKQGNTSTAGNDANNQADTSTNSANSSTLTNSQYQQLLNLLNQGVSSSSSANATLSDIPQSGNTIHTCSYMTSVCLINSHTSND